MQKKNLHLTHFRLTLLFIGGAFIFLIILEALFLVGRFFTENSVLQDRFEQGVNRQLHRMGNDIIGDHQKEGLDQKKGPPGVGFLIIDGSGVIQEDHLLGESIFSDSIEKVLTPETLAELHIQPELTYIEDLWLQKQPIPNSRFFIVFVAPGGYLWEDILRDILRFLLIDFFIIAPLGYLIHTWVGRILDPVEKNMDMMSHFIHDAGHELKTPMAIISGNLQLMRDLDVRDPELITGSLSTLADMSQSLSALLELSRLDHTQVSVSAYDVEKNIREIITRYSDMVEAQSITVDLSLDSSRLLCEPGHFSLLFSNLFSNALRYNRQNGTISVSWKDGVLIVRDTGIGMSREVQGKVFDRFFRADRSGKIPGSGIGLAIVDRVGKLYGAHISLSSVEGEGSEFTVQFPRKLVRKR